MLYGIIYGPRPKSSGSAHWVNPEGDWEIIAERNKNLVSGYISQEQVDK